MTNTRRISGSRLLPSLLAMGMLYPSIGEAATLQGEELPQPLVEFTFDDGLANSGTAGGDAKLSVYAEADEPVLATGLWGRYLDTNQSSRFGGSAADTDPAGSALLFSNAQLDQLRDFTVVFWMRASAGERGLASRIINKAASWEITYTDGVAALYATESHGKRHYSPQRSAGDLRGQWTFTAIIVDTSTATVRLVMGGKDVGLSETVRHDLVEPVPQVASTLQIGNFNGIRPFKGSLDNIRIYARALTEEEVRLRFQTDLAERSHPESVYSRAVVPPNSRMFRLAHSTIPFSSRWQNRRQDETFQLLRDYHATHLLWVYGTGAPYVKKAHDLGLFYEGTLNGMYGAQQSGESPDAQDDTTGRAWNFDGHKFVPGHIELWPNKWNHWRGCHNSPDFRKQFWEAADTLVNIGCDAIHMDDWEMVLVPAGTGRGCFCPWCMALFRDFLKASRSADQLRELGIEDIETFDYREYLKTRHGITSADECLAEYRTIFQEDPLAALFVSAQRAGLRNFYKQLRQHLDEVSPNKYIPVSVNNQFYRRAADRRFRGYYCVDVVDFFIGEASQSMQDASHFIHGCKLAEGFDIPQVMMCKPRVLAKAQAALATTYALGSSMRVPWDVYMDNDPQTHQPAPRYYGTLEDWQPFYNLVHDHSHLFDGYESAAEVAVILNADTDTFESFWSLADRLAREQIQYRVIPAAAEYNRIPLKRDVLERFSHAILLSPAEGFCEEDRQVLESVRRSLRVRFLSPDTDIAAELVRSGRKLLHFEGPQNVYAFLRVKPNAAVIHLANWNTTAEGLVDPFGHVTLQLPQSAIWGETPKATYYEPNQPTGMRLEPEFHKDILRITVPKLNTWGIVEILPNADTQ